MTQQTKRKPKFGVDARLYEAFINCRGVRLSAKEVQELIGPDDAMSTRIGNAAYLDAGLEEQGLSFDDGPNAPRTWRGLLSLLRRIHKAELDAAGKEVE